MKMEKWKGEREREREREREKDRQSPIGKEGSIKKGKKGEERVNVVFISFLLDARIVRAHLITACGTADMRVYTSCM